jgi:hypothetical protein
MTDADGRHGGGPTYGEFPCREPGCERVFKLEGYRKRHESQEHRRGRVTPDRNGRLVCPECMNPFAARYLSAHMRRAHAIYGGLSGVRRPDRAADRAALVPVDGAPAKHNGAGGSEFRRVDGWILLEDRDGGIWLAEKIR